MKKEVANKTASESKKLVGIEKINTLGQLIKSGYQSKSIKDEVRDNLIGCLQNKENPFLKTREGFSLFSKFFLTELLFLNLVEHPIKYH